MRNALTTLFKGGSIRGDAAQIYAYQFVTLGLSLIGGVIVARTLGPAQKGVLDIFNLINSFIVELGLFGFGSGLLYYLANKRRPLNEVHGASLLFSLIIGLLTALVGWLGLPVWKTIFPGLSGWIILLAFLLSPVSYYRLSWSNIMTGINQAVVTYKIGFFLTILSLVFIFLLWGLGRLDVKSIIGLTVALSILTAGIGFYVLYKREPSLAPSASLIKGSLQYGSIVYIGNIANILHFKIDQVMINYWLGTKAVGLYAVSVNWAEMLFILDSGILSAALYKISSTTQEESLLLSQRLFKTQIVISGIFGIILALLAYPLLSFLYGKDYRESIVPLILLIPGIIAWSSAKIISNMLIYNRGSASFVVKIAVAGLLLNIVLNYLFIVLFKIGIIGASISSSLSYLMVAGIIALEANKNE